MVRTRVSTLEAEQCALQSTPSTKVAGQGQGQTTNSDSIHGLLICHILSL